MSFAIVAYVCSLIACSIAGTIAYEQGHKIAFRFFFFSIGVNIGFLIVAL